MDFHIKKPELKKNVSWLAFPRGAAAVSSDYLYITNGLGKFVWNLCDGSRTVSEIQKEIERMGELSSPMVSECELEEFMEKKKNIIKRLRKEIEEFLVTMEKEGLIRFQE